MNQKSDIQQESSQEIKVFIPNEPIEIAGGTIQTYREEIIDILSYHKSNVKDNSRIGNLSAINEDIK